MKYHFSFVLLICLSIINTSSACDIEGKTGFLPKNDLRIPVNSKMANNITKEKFNQIIDKVDTIYSPIVSAMGKKLKMHKRWDTDEVNARAYQSKSGRILNVEMYGGLARHKKNTPDGFTLVLCHEVGHHLGGAPIKSGTGWISNEGQSDYWSALKCFRKFAQNDDNEKIISKMRVPSMVVKRCEEAFDTSLDIAICKRSSMAALDLGKVLNHLKKETKIVKFNTPDSNKVRRTSHTHPASQCRLDTLYQGSICHISDDIDVSNKDANQGTCNRRASHEHGLRPRCWYKPRS